MFGQITDISGKALPNAKVLLNRGSRSELPTSKALRVSESGAKFRAILPPGRYSLSISLTNFENKTVYFDIPVGGKRVRKNVVLDSMFGDKLTYHSSPAAIETKLKELSKKYTDITRTYPLGKPGSGKHKIWAMEVASDLHRSHLRPAIKVVAGVHGNEAVSSEVALAFAEFILSHSERDDEIYRILQRYSIHIIPLLNRDGGGHFQPGNCSNQVGPFFLYHGEK